MNPKTEPTQSEERRKTDPSIDAGPAEPKTFEATPEGLPVDENGRLTKTDGSPIHAKPADEKLDPDGKHDQLAAKEEEAEDRQEALIDEGIEETFPASDPVSVKRIT
jgi:hypothetical protein